MLSLGNIASALTLNLHISKESCLEKPFHEDRLREHRFIVRDTCILKPDTDQY